MKLWAFCMHLCHAANCILNKKLCLLCCVSTELKIRYTLYMWRLNGKLVVIGDNWIVGELSWQWSYVTEVWLLGKRQIGKSLDNGSENVMKGAGAKWFSDSVSLAIFSSSCWRGATSLSIPKEKEVLCSGNFSSPRDMLILMFYP